MWHSVVAVRKLPTIHAMENSRFPIEICEKVIGDVADWSRPEDLMACAITCKAWTPRSLYNLYREVRLSARNAAMFLESLAKFPELAAWTRGLQVRGAYLPLGLVLSPRLLTGCEHLVLDNNGGYPPLYMESVVKPLLSTFIGITRLDIEWTSKSSRLSSLISLACAVPRMQELSVNILLRPTMSRWETKKWSTLTQRGVFCTHLKTLAL